MATKTTLRFLCFVIYGLALLFRTGSCKTDDSPGFFLKVTKNVPRLGKRSENDIESSFFKNYKAIPRMGRSDDNHNGYSTLENWLNENAYLRRLGKRVLMHSAHIAGPATELSVVQPVTSNTLIELLDKNAIPSDNVKFVHWKDFDLALQFDEDLYLKVISLGRRPDERLKQDLSVGSYTPLFNRGAGRTNANDFLLYSPADEMDETFGSNVLHYNRD